MARSSFGFALLLAAAPVWAQTAPPEPKPRLTVSVEAGRAEAVARKDRTLVVYQATRKKDLRVTGTRVAVEKGREVTQTFSILAERVVAFLPPPSGLGRAALPIQALYAQGFVRVEVSAPGRGTTVLEAAEAYLDFARERAFLRQAEVRFGGQGGRGLSGAAFVVRAERLRLLGTAKLVGEGASVSVCTHGKPHFAVTCDRLELEAEPPPPDPEFPTLGALGGLIGATLPDKLRRPNLFAGLLKKTGKRRPSGSDALRQEGERPRLIDASGVAITVLPPWRSADDPHRLPLLPFMTWGTNWPVPRIRVGSSSQFGTTVSVRLRRRLLRERSPTLGELELTGVAGVDYFERRGTAGDLGLEWKTDLVGAGKGEGFLRAYGLRDRADEDRVETPIRNEGRFWLRGLLRQELPGRLQVDAEVSRVSDRGFLLEYFRRTAQTKKEQETYLNLRGSWDDLGARIIGRWRINDFQTQVEQLPELRVDWIETPVAYHERLGMLTFDAALRAGHLRLRPDSSSVLESYRAHRGDTRFGLGYAKRLGPLQLHGWAGARGTSWSGRAADEDESISRFAADAGWSLTTVLWRRFNTPFGVLRHEIIPEVGTSHVYAVSREREALLAFDDVEQVTPTDRVVLRLRTRLWTDARRRHRKLVDLIVESAYLLRTQGDDVGRAWAPLRYDLRLNLLTWLRLRARAEHDVNRGKLVDLNVDTSVVPTPGLVLGVNYRELNGPTRSRALGWSASWRITKAWEVALDQQYDFQTREFIRHRGRLIRYFHRFALELTVSNNPQQDDVSVSFSFSPVFSDRDPFADDRDAELYRP